MHGGVYEWVQDWDGPYNVKVDAGPQGPTAGKERVVRGGCTKSMQEADHGRETTPAERMRFVRSASRHKLPQDYELPITGMRLVLAPVLEQARGTAEDTAIRESDLAAFKKAVEKE